MGCGGGGGGSNEVKETSSDIELSKTTKEQWGRFKQVHQPLFKDLAADLKSIGEAEKRTVTGAVNAGVTKAYGEAGKQTQEGLQRRGLDPLSGVVQMGDVARDKSSAATQGMVKGRTQVDSAKVAGLQNIVNMARGDAGEAMQGLSNIATSEVQTATQKAIEEQQARNDTIETASSLAGMGLAAYGGGWGKTPGAATPGATPKPWINPNQ